MPNVFNNIYQMNVQGVGSGNFRLDSTTAVATNMNVTEADNLLSNNDTFEVAAAIGGQTSFTYIGTVTIGGQAGFMFSNGTSYYFATDGTAPPGTALNVNHNPDETTATPTCFYPGTFIATPQDERAVETLKTGDEILTADGRVMTINWLGRQTVSTIFADPLRVLPIRVKAGALGNGLPLRDLLVSPDHGLFMDGVLANAGTLVNGVTIVRERDVPQTFTYYHIETAEHVLVLAEGVTAETFVDNVDRMRFDNWEERAALPYGDRIAEMPFPRAKAVRQLPASLLQRLEDVACIVESSAA